MSLSPKRAAKLADLVYDVHDSMSLRASLSKKELSEFIGTSRESLTAEVGSRIFQVLDGFGICSKGSGEYEKHIFIVFRGTTSRNFGADWLTDAYCGVNLSETGTLVHAGFQQTFSSMLRDISSFVSQHSDVTHIHCIGHSLGGAIANLAADWAANALGKPTSLYTFGAPRVGWGAPGFPRKLTEGVGDTNIFRVHHRNDPVTMVPVFPFAHAPTKGNSYYLPYGGLVISFAAHKMANYQNSVGNGSWSSISQPAPFSEPTIKAWLANGAHESSFSSLFWERLNYALAYVCQTLLAPYQARLTAGVTVVDYLSMMLHKGVTLATEATETIVLLIKKMMRALGMKVAETVEELSYQLIRMVLSKLLSRLYNEARRAIKNIMD